MEFRLVGAKRTSHLRFVAASVAAAGLATGVIVLSLAIAGVLSWPYAIGIAAFLAVSPLVFVGDLSRATEGFAEVTDSHLIIKARGRFERYRLDDIADVNVKPTANMLGFDSRSGFVKLRLRRSLKEGIWPTNYGTDIIGIPTLFFRSANLALEDAADFAKELQRRVRQEHG